MRMLLTLLAFAVALPGASMAATPKPISGGSNQRAAVEGCMNKWLFNGVWRLRLLSVDPGASYNDGSQTTGVGVKIQLRNGTHKDLSPDQTGLADINGRGIVLGYNDDNTEDVVGSGTGLTEQLLDKTMPPGGGVTMTLYFPYGPDKSAKPAKLIIPVDQHSEHNIAHAKYSVKDPSFRVNLTCGS